MAEDVLGISTVTFDEIRPAKATQPEEAGYAPFCTAIGKPGDWKGAWPQMGKIENHIGFWQHNPEGRKYAELDVVYTRALYWYFSAKELGMSVNN